MNSEGKGPPPAATSEGQQKRTNSGIVARPGDGDNVLAEIDAALTNEAEQALYVVPDQTSADALAAVGLRAVDAGKPSLVDAGVADAVSRGVPVVVVAAVDGTTAGYVAEQAPGVDLRDLPLPLTYSSVWAMVGYVPGVRAWTKEQEMVGRETWLAWAQEARQSAKSRPAAADDAPNQDDPALQPFYAAWRPLRSLDELPPPVDYLLRLPTKHGEPVPPGSLGDGFLRRGVVASLVGQGGVGKTMAMLQLGIAIAIGDRWLGYFPAPLQRGRVLILLGEEDAEEAHRRLYWATRNLSPADRRAVEQQVVVVGLRGGQFPLLEQPKPGRTCPTIYFQTLESVLHKRAGEHGWAAVLIDPLSRFAGIDTDLSNANGTAVVQVLERLTTAPGNPSVVVAPHSSKASRQQGQTAVVRGASALTDGVRLEMTLSREGERVRLATSKTNYGSMLAGKGIPVEVGEHGVLSVPADYRPGAPTAADANPLLAESLERDIAALVASVAERAGQDGRYRGSAETAGNLVGIGDKRARKALKEALHRGLLVAGGTTRDRWFAAGDSRQGALPGIERGDEGDDDSRQRPISGTPPVPPNAGDANWDRGTPSLDSRQVPGIAGNCRESESDTDDGQPEQPKRRRAKRRSPGSPDGGLPERPRRKRNPHPKGATDNRAKAPGCPAVG